MANSGAVRMRVNFNSRTSCEVRHGYPVVPRFYLRHFNSRTSCEVRLALQGDHPHKRAISTHAPLARCDIQGLEAQGYTVKGDFNSRTSCEVRLDDRIDTMDIFHISTHAPLARCDLHQTPAAFRVSDFNSRTSCEVRPHAMQAKCTPNNFNSRTSCEVRPPQQLENPVHANFNSRTSCEVRRTLAIMSGIADRFQLTHLLRGATLPADQRPAGPADFNSRTSCEVRLSRKALLDCMPISTHAPLARCDAAFAACHAAILRFQLTHLLRGATSPSAFYHPTAINFNSRTSCEVRQSRPDAVPAPTHFNSRTSCEVRPAHPSGALALHRHFNSRTSCEVRRSPLRGLTGNLLISTHAPLARCDDANECIEHGCEFQLTHLLRGATSLLACRART